MTDALIYPGRLNALNGEPGGGKTWVALHTCAEAIQNGYHALYIDLEDHPGSGQHRRHPPHRRPSPALPPTRPHPAAVGTPQHPVHRTHLGEPMNTWTTIVVPAAKAMRGRKVVDR